MAGGEAIPSHACGSFDGHLTAIWVDVVLLIICSFSVTRSNDIRLYQPSCRGGGRGRIKGGKYQSASGPPPFLNGTYN